MPEEAIPKTSYPQPAFDFVYFRWLSWLLWVLCITCSAHGGAITLCLVSGTSAPKLLQEWSIWSHVISFTETWQPAMCFWPPKNWWRLETLASWEAWVMTKTTTSWEPTGVSHLLGEGLTLLLLMLMTRTYRNFYFCFPLVQNTGRKKQTDK